MTHAHVSDLETRLVQAVVADTLTLHYQPVVALPSGRPIAVEALARWNEPGLGSVPPDVFIPIAERTGLIHRLGRQVLERACAAAAAWQPGRPSAPHVAVNVSPLQLADPAFEGHVAHALGSSGLAADRLVLEITESAAIADLQESAVRLTALRSLGVKVALDDFGIGHSPLSMLKHLPIDILKIDRSFVTRVHENARDAVIVRLLVDTAHTLGLTVCGEGVESPEQARQLLAVGCDTAQGWHFGRPVPDSPELAAALDPDQRLAPDLGAGSAPIQIGSEEVVTILSPDAEVLYASPGSLAVLGYTPSQLMGGSAVQHLHPEERDDVLTAMREADAAPSTRTHRVRHSDGGFRWLRTRAQLLRDGDGAPSEIVATSRDVTAQVEAQQLLKSMGSTLDWAFDRSPFGMALSDVDGAIVRSNHSFAAMLGYEAAELVGRRVRDLTHPDDVPADERNVRQLLAQPQGSSQQLRKRYLHRDGSPVAAHVWATALDDGAGRPAYVVAHILQVGADE